MITRLKPQLNRFLNWATCVSLEDGAATNVKVFCPKWEFVGFVWKYVCIYVKYVALKISGMPVYWYRF